MLATGSIRGNVVIAACYFVCTGISAARLLIVVAANSHGCAGDAAICAARAGNRSDDYRSAEDDRETRRHGDGTFAVSDEIAAEHGEREAQQETRDEENEGNT